MLKAAYIMNPAEWPRVYTSAIHSELTKLVDIGAHVLSPQDALKYGKRLDDVEIVFSGWGGPVFDEEFLGALPRLQAVFYGAGAVARFLTPAFWQRKIAITTANTMNAIPVMEFTLAHILLGLKRAWAQSVEARRRRAFFLPQLPVPGAYGTTVGLVSMSTVGRLVRERLAGFDLKVMAYDPTIGEEEARGLDVKLLSLDQLFSQCDIVSLHAPLIPATVGMITGDLFARMKSGATFINTARGSIVCESEMIEVLRARHDLTAVLDVTDPEPPASNCPLFDLPNVVLTPHIAGSLDGECERMGRWMVEELRRYLAGQPLQGEVRRPSDIAPASIRQMATAA